MPPLNRLGTCAIAAGVVALFLTDAAQGQSRRSREREAPSIPQAVDKRDRVVAAPGSRYQGRAYWQALGQCGGAYFKLNTLYADASAQAQVVKKDRNAAAALSGKAENARRAATMFFEAAERVLIADRKVGREAAVLTYDGAATEIADRLKTVDAARDALKACPALYENCRAALAKTCTADAVPES